jgi:Uma2 family endonuclease
MTESRSHYRISTLEDLVRVSHGEATHELSEGQLLVAEPPPGWRHGAVAMIIGSAIHAFAAPRKLGQVVTCDTWFVLQRDPDTVRGPDVAFVCQKRCENLGNVDAPFDGAPDLAVEVISPSQTKASVARKVRDYQQAGTGVIWLVDARARVITILDGQSSRRLGPGDTLTCPEFLPGFSLPTDDIFS